MKIILLISLFLMTKIFANYAFSDEKTVKIDMHGGKSESYSNTRGFSTTNFKNGTILQNRTIKNPIKPTTPTVENIKLKYKNNEGKK